MDFEFKKKLMQIQAKSKIEIKKNTMQDNQTINIRHYLIHNQSNSIHIMFTGYTSQLFLRTTLDSARFLR